MEPKPSVSNSPIFCNHANECPVSCPCDVDCYCKQHTCKPMKYDDKYGNCRVISQVPVRGPIEEPEELYEESIAQMRKWLSDIYPASKVDRALHIEYITVPDSIVKKLYMRARIWTLNNVYYITASIHTQNPPGYLGCIGDSRKCRTGETWTRGNDLADGRFKEETWQNVLCDIVRYEAEEIKSWKWKEELLEIK